MLNDRPYRGDRSHVAPTGSASRIAQTASAVVLLASIAAVGCTARSERELREAIADDYSTIVIREGGIGSGDRADDSASEIIRAAFADVNENPQALPMWIALFDGFSLAMWDLEDPSSMTADGNDVNLDESAERRAESSEIAQATSTSTPTTENSATGNGSAPPVAEIEPWRVENGVIIATA
ncbi:MAG: hypothetical protein ACOC0P_03320, partial [Planctomycetota bacterium]